jgi:hypothetical protein
VSHYKALCDVVDNLVTTLQADLIGTGINDSIDYIQSYDNGETNEYGSTITVQPFTEINQEFISNEI